MPTIAANPICRWYLLKKGIASNLIETMNIGGTISSNGAKITMVNAMQFAHINGV